MVWRKILRALLSPLAANRWRTGSLFGFAIWCILLRYGDLGVLLTVYSMPVGIALFAMGPLEFIPDSWFWVNAFVNGMISLFFQGSLIFIWVTLSFELSLSKRVGGVFIVLCMVLQVIIMSWIKRRMIHSYLRKKSEQRNRSQ